MKYGVIILRAQPFHIGHIYVINEMLRENDKVLVIVGSANKSGTERNPLDIDFRMDMVRKSLVDAGLIVDNLGLNKAASDKAASDKTASDKTTSRVKIMSLCDWSMESAYALAKEWGSYLYYNVVNAIAQKEFSLYYNDDKKIAENWFVPELQPRVTICNTPRGDIDVSGTQIREALLNNDDEYLKTALAPSVYEMREQIKDAIVNAKGEDFIMQ